MNATDYLKGSKYCTYSSINPAIIELTKLVHPALINNSNLTDIDFNKTINAFEEVSELDRDKEINIPVNTYNLLEQIKKNLYEALIHYFDSTSPEALLVAFLDPCFKKLQSFTQDQKQDAKYELQKVYDSMKSNQPSTTSHLPLIPSQQQKKRSLFDAFTKVSTAENEINEYLALEEIPFDKDPYTWWNERKEKFPILSQLSRKILGIRAASTPSEQLFQMQVIF